MIAITKEFKQMLQDQFKSQGVTQLPIDALADALKITLKEFELLLMDDSIKDEYKLIRAKNGINYVKRFIPLTTGGKKMSSTLEIQWDNLGGCPCFTCYELDKCDIGNPISSVDCPIFTRWLFAEKQDKK
jgi:hypothetical protein